MADDRPTSGTVLKAGYLEKTGSNRKSFKKRWVVLRPSKVSWYASEEMKKELGFISLRASSEIKLVNTAEMANTGRNTIKKIFGKKNKAQNLFEIFTEERTLLLKASSLMVVGAWMEEIDQAIEDLKTLGDDVDADEQIAFSAGSGSAGSPTATADGEGSSDFADGAAAASPPSPGIERVASNESVVSNRSAGGGSPAVDVGPDRSMVLPASQNILAALIQETPCTELNPREFFVAWCGVLVLAYEPFPNCVLSFKQDIRGAVPSLADENPGSRWPKTTLAALRGDAPLTRVEAGVLRAICDDFQEAVASARPIEVTQVTLAVYGCRSLENRLVSLGFPLRPGTKETDSTNIDHAAAVDAVLGDFAVANIEGYMDDLQRDGNRAAHYRTPTVGSTLVVDGVGEAYSTLLADFQAAVEAALPGRYTFFLPQSLHITIRGLKSA